MELSPLSQPGVLTETDRFIFECFGYLIIENVLSADECKETLEAAARIHRGQPKNTLNQVGKGFETEPAIERLIDHPAVLPKIRGLYGDRFVLSAAWCTVLPAKTPWIHWHRDHPSAYDYDNVSYPAPLMQLRASYNLSDQSELNMGNMMLIPGSHRSPIELPIDKREEIYASPIQHIIRAKAGSVLLFHNAVYHCPMPNYMDHDRYNMHFIYSPPWMRLADRDATDPEFLKRTSPRRRAVMGHYHRPDAPYSGGFQSIPFDDEWFDPGLKPVI